MAKLHYVEGDYEGALSLYARAGLEDWPLTGVPPYRLRMAAEAYATQGEAARVPRAEPRLSLPGGSSWRPRCDPRPWASSPAHPGARGFRLTSGPQSSFHSLCRSGCGLRWPAAHWVTQGCWP